MNISINPQTFEITIPKTYLTLVSGTLYNFDTDQFRADLKDWEYGQGGITFLKTHIRNAEFTLVGITYAQGLLLLPPYSITFEDGNYTVVLVGSNNNFFDVDGGVLNQNQVQVIPTNSAGLIKSETTITEQDKTDIKEGVWDVLMSGHKIPKTFGNFIRRIRNQKV